MDVSLSCNMTSFWFHQGCYTLKYGTKQQEITITVMMMMMMMSHDRVTIDGI
jgi:hypothetical protein